MDFNYDMDSFEKMLRQKTDEFKMYPTKRVWFSIYNNIHPGRKWPSVAMGMLMIAALLMIGYFNTTLHSSQQLNSLAAVQPATTTSEPKAVFDKAHKLPTIPSPTLAQISSSFPATNAAINNQPKTDRTTIAPKIGTQQIAPNQSGHRSMHFTHGSTTGLVEAGAVVSAGEIVTNQDNAATADSPELTENAGTNNSTEQQDLARNLGLTQIPAAKIIAELATLDVSYHTTTPTINGLAVGANGNASATDQQTVADRAEQLNEKSWMEHDIAYHQPKPRKWAGKLGWQAYITPSIIFSRMENHASSDIDFFAGDINKTVTIKPSLGLEAGAGLQFKLMKRVQLKAGLQFNYTRYNTEAYLNDHPNTTTITLNDPNGRSYQAFRSSPYSNSIGLVTSKLHNQTYQVSIPIGVDLTITGNDILQWKVGTTIQPTYVLGATSYLISTDHKSFVQENSFINRFNLNASLETFISFKTGSGLTWQIGPQFRRQLATTNNKTFAIQEKLNSYGLKIGVSKLF